MSKAEEDVGNLQAICAISKERATELLEATSGSLDRALELHFQMQQQQQQQSSSCLTASDDDKVLEVQFTSTRPTKKLKTGISPKKKEKSTAKSTVKRTASISPAKGQGTLHSFLGLPKLKGKRTSQLKIDSMFAKKNVKQKNSVTEEKEENNNQKIQQHHARSPRIGKQQQPEEATAANPETKTKGESAHVAPAKNQEQSEKPLSIPISSDGQEDPRMCYAAFAKAFTDMVSTTKRNAKLETLKTLIVGVIVALGGIHGDAQSRRDDGEKLTFALELISGKISGGEPLQVSGAAVSTAVQTVTGASKARLREVYRDTGDLGDVAAHFFLSSSQSVKGFFHIMNKISDTDAENGASILRIHGLFRSIASVQQGTGSQKERQSLLVKLLRLASTKEEIRFLVRALLGNMRLGATMKSILAALAMAVQEVSSKEATTQDPSIQIVQKTFDICPRLNKIALSLLCGGIDNMVQECTLEVGTPLQPMLANPAHEMAEVKKLMSKALSSKIISSSALCSRAVAEWKYDGVRCQAHFDGVNMKMFSRHLLENTNQFPDAVEYILEARQHGKVTSFIIDSEIVAVARSKADDDGSQTRLLPFQVLSTRRGTKTSNEKHAVEIRVFAFDLMYLNGTSLLNKPLFERQKLLRESFRETQGFTFASSLQLSSFDGNAITCYLQQAVEGGAEGLMVKLTGESAASSDLESPEIPKLLVCPYESGTRSQTWLKVKRDYVSGFADTIDVVPIGAWFGNGRKAEKGFWSPILLAIYDEDDGIFRSISRCMSFTDDMYAAIKDFYLNGTPYPADVGMSGTKDDFLKVANETNDDAAGEHRVPVVGVEVDELEGSENDVCDSSGGNESVGVNCFPGRPSSSVYVTNENPSIWFKPLHVWEVSFADLTLSRTHMAAAGLVDDPEGRGVALRFPRFKRRRPDKGVEQATSSFQIAQLFAKQFKQR